MASPEYTASDLDALDDLIQSEGYKLLSDRLNMELERRRRELEGNLNEVHTGECRGRIIALRMALQLPDVLRNDIQVAIKEQP